MGKNNPVIDLALNYIYEFKDYCFSKPPWLKENKNNPLVFGSLVSVKKTIQKIFSIKDINEQHAHLDDYLKIEERFIQDFFRIGDRILLLH